MSTMAPQRRQQQHQQESLLMNHSSNQQQSHCTKTGYYNNSSTKNRSKHMDVAAAGIDNRSCCYNARRLLDSYYVITRYSSKLYRRIGWRMIMPLFIWISLIMNFSVIKMMVSKRFLLLSSSSSSLSTDGSSRGLDVAHINNRGHQRELQSVSSYSSSSSSSFSASALMSSIGNILSGGHSKIDTADHERERCAINFFGLPRAYESLVLPSIITNVIKQNIYCDYYVHYNYMTEELKGRSGKGGTIDPTAILLLRDAVHKVANERNEYPLPIVEFVYDTDDDFWPKYEDIINKTRSVKVDDQYLYFPWHSKSYKFPDTMDNIIKMWHSIQSAFELMERSGIEHNITYNTVAMLRSDVVFVTPINVNEIPPVTLRDEPVEIDQSDDDSIEEESDKQRQLRQRQQQKRRNQLLLEQQQQQRYQESMLSTNLPPVVVPDFGNHPVSDRLIYGPYEAVKIWATQRFNHLDQHVERMYHHSPGFGMHSERFLNFTIFPLIRSITTIRPHPTICFFRARADESVWVSDCNAVHGKFAAQSVVDNFQNASLLDVVQNAIQRKCPDGEIPTRRARYGLSLNCGSGKIIITNTTATTNVARRSKD